MPSRKQPVYHRLGDGSDLIATIMSSGELMGGVARNYFQTHIPKVKAYDGPLPPGENGFEFATSVSPDPGHVPGKPTWSAGRPGVERRRVGADDFAVIPCTVLKVRRNK
jgi:hypothetical protein